MSEDRNRPFISTMPPTPLVDTRKANLSPPTSFTDDQNTNASPPSISSTSTNKKVVIKSADMKQELQIEAVNIAISAFKNLSVEKDIAEHIKREFDNNHGPTWHCIVGKNFGSYVTHETNHFVYFYLDSKAVLLFKSG